MGNIKICFENPSGFWGSQIQYGSSRSGVAISSRRQGRNLLVWNGKRAGGAFLAL